jgi:hypothetical protein
MRRCVKCILPDNFPNITFDAEGICNYCSSHRATQYKGEAALRNLLDTCRGRAIRYDCIVPISGGKDSTFVLYQATKEYKMRVLALNYYSSFASDQARVNLENAIRMSGADYVQIKSDAQRACLKDNIEAWARKPSSEPFPSFCYGCREGYLHGAFLTAARLGVPLILLGDSEMEKLIVTGPMVRFHKSDLVHFVIKFAKNPFYLHPKRVYHDLMVTAEFPLPARICQYLTRNRPKIVHLFDYVRWDDARILSTVREKMGWDKPASSASGWRFDCQVHPLMEYMYRKKLGFTERDELYSRMIRNGSLSRSEALKLMDLESQNDEEDVAVANQLLNKLGLPNVERLVLLGSVR